MCCEDDPRLRKTTAAIKDPGSIRIEAYRIVKTHRVEFWKTSHKTFTTFDERNKKALGHVTKYAERFICALCDVMFSSALVQQVWSCPRSRQTGDMGYSSLYATRH